MPARQVPVDVEETVLPGDYKDIDGVVAICTRCKHETESFGTSSASVRRCLALLREECPLGEHNFYVADEEDQFP